MGVIDEAVLVAVLAGQHAGTAGATDGVGYEAIGETYALVCDAVDVGGLDVSLVVGTDGLEGVIVRHDIKDIRWAWRACPDVFSFWLQEVELSPPDLSELNSLFVFMYSA